MVNGTGNLPLAFFLSHPKSIDSHCVSVTFRSGALGSAFLVAFAGFSTLEAFPFFGLASSFSDFLSCFLVSLGLVSLVSLGLVSVSYDVRLQNENYF